MRDVTDLVRQSLLDEAQGNLTVAFELACERYAREILFAEQIERDRDAWRKGASLAFLRMKAEPGAGKIDDVPTPITDDWIATGREARTVR